MGEPEEPARDTDEDMKAFLLADQPADTYSTLERVLAQSLQREFSFFGGSAESWLKAAAGVVRKTNDAGYLLIIRKH